jgi:hypothetical protein
MFEGSMPVNRFLVSETINGTCTAHFYINEDDRDNGGRGVIYSDNGNKPQTRRSRQEAFIDMRVNTNTPKGWRSGTFSTDGSIASGSYIWFGCFADFFWFPRFDYGSKLFAGDWYDIGDSVPNNYPTYYEGWFKDFKLSMYFTYSSAQNYVRTLTQGVKLSDNRKIKTDYSRKAIQTVNANTDTKPLQIFIRKLQEAVQGLDCSSFPVLFLRIVIESESMTDLVKQTKALFRGLTDTVGIESDAKPGRFYFLTLTDTVHAVGYVFRGLLLFVRIVTQVFVRDYLLGRFLKARSELELKSCIQREIELESRIY